jgi:ubiquinone biosynthesis protein
VTTDPVTTISPDTAFGAFSDAGPWNIEPDRLTWRRGLAGVRTRLNASLPQLTQRRTLPPLRRMGTTLRYIGPALALWYLRDRRRGGTESIAGISRRLRVAAEKLGPTYIKLGQIIASGDGVFPAELVAEFKWCRDQVTAEPWPVVEQVLTDELGGPLSSAFASVERTPLAAASIAQVHAATLLDGTAVVIKVQRPSVSARVRQDLAVMAWLAPHLVGRIPVAALANPPALVELFAETIVEELDFRLEAANMLDVGHVLAETGQRAIIVPRPHPRLVTRRMLVMERLDGFAWDDVAGMRAIGIDTTAVLRAEMISFLEGAMLYGVFHGDLHGGNLFVRPDGRLALLDFGITGRLGEQQRLAFLQLLIGGSTSNVPIQVQALKQLGALDADADVDQVIRDLGLDKPTPDVTALSAEELTAQLRDLTKQLLAYGARMPKELMLFVKDLLFLDGAVATLAPGIDLLGEVAQIATYFFERYGERIASDVGLDPRTVPIDLDGLRSSIGLSSETEQFTYRDLQERRDAVRKKFERRET